MTDKKKMLLLGNGAREHGYAAQLNASDLVQEIWCSPGTNAGILGLAKCRPVDSEVKGLGPLVDFCRGQKVNLVIIGPEQPLADGIADLFGVANIPVLGPTKQAAELESSKQSAKEVMLRAGVPTAAYQVFSAVQLDAALACVEKSDGPWVIKADGLAAGKGVRVCFDRSEARETTREWLEGKFGEASRTILIEEFLPPHSSLKRAEISVQGLVDQHGDVLLFAAAADHKAAFDGDQGPNTGGMGAYAPVPWVTDAMMGKIQDTIFNPVIARMKKIGKPFSGILYAGLMWTPGGPKVVELNVRGGDPEWPALAPLYEPDVCVDLFNRVANGGSIKNMTLQPKAGHSSVCVVLTSHGYPGPCKQALGMPIDFSRGPKQRYIQIYHAGTKRGENGQVLVDGGRVLDVVVTAALSLKNVATIARFAAESITWTDQAGNGPQFRRDIGLGVPDCLGSECQCQGCSDCCGCHRPAGGK